MKKIVIISMNRDAAQMYADSIIDVFGSDRVCTEPVIIGEDNIPGDGDLYLVSKGHIEHRMGTPLRTEFDFPLGISVLDIAVEFCIEDVAPLQQLPKGTHCLLVNSTEMLAMECISDLHNTMGIYHLTMIPYSGENDLYDDDIQVAVTIGEPELVPDNITKVIDLGARKLSPETMVEIAVNLKMEEVLDTEKFYAYRKRFAGSAVKVGDLIAGSSYYKNFLDLMIECLDDGIVGINEKEKIFCANEKASEILGVKNNSLFGESAGKALAFCWDEKYMSSKKKVNFVTKYHGVALNISVNPIIRKGAFKGVLLVIQRFYEQEQKQSKARLQLFEKGYRAKYTFDDIIGDSSKIKEICRMAEQMARSSSTVLITGETGTGKELLASAIHNASPRKNEPYIAINCSAMSDNLLESELFGYDEGAFTGARKSGKLGLFEYAHRGTLFLDEIEDMSSALQLKLLRVLQEKEIMHIGGDKIIKVDVRIIAATNQNLEELVNQGKIRKDLYYRLNTLQLDLPPLRERKEDILPLLYHLMGEANADFQLDEEAEKALLSHAWEGNVRELQNYVEYFDCIQKKVIHYSDLPKAIGKKQLPKEDGEVQAVLEILYNGYRKRIHMGRKSMSEGLQEKGLFLSEQQVRTITEKLEERNLVMVSKGRAGTRLTPEGVKYCEKLGMGSLY